MTVWCLIFVYPVTCRGTLCRGMVHTLVYPVTCRGTLCRGMVHTLVEGHCAGEWYIH